MTDEQLISILDKYDSRSQTHPNYYLEKEVLSAMKEAVEKGAVGFMNWYMEGEYFALPSGYFMKQGFTEKLTIEQLYLEFLKPSSVKLTE